MDDEPIMCPNDGRVLAVDSDGDFVCELCGYFQIIGPTIHVPSPERGDN